jgi:hypothetical protein
MPSSVPSKSKEPSTLSSAVPSMSREPPSASSIGCTIGVQQAVPSKPSEPLSLPRSIPLESSCHLSQVSMVHAILGAIKVKGAFDVPSAVPLTSSKPLSACSIGCTIQVQGAVKLVFVHAIQLPLRTSSTNSETTKRSHSSVENKLTKPSKQQCPQTPKWTCRPTDYCSNNIYGPQNDQT